MSNLKSSEPSHGYVEHPLSPIFDRDSRILILGSFPSIKTREANFFYGHPQNRFWPMLSALLEIDPLLGTANRIARERLYASTALPCGTASPRVRLSAAATAQFCNVMPNDFTELFATAQIRHVFCNGAAAYQYFKKYQRVPKEVGVHRMPSTSPANATKSLDDLIAAWSVILPYLI